MRPPVTVISSTGEAAARCLIGCVAEAGRTMLTQAALTLIGSRTMSRTDGSAPARADCRASGLNG